MDRADLKKIIVLLSSLFILGIYFVLLPAPVTSYESTIPTIRTTFPVNNDLSEKVGRETMGLVVAGEPIKKDVNLTFNYPFPLGFGEANITATVTDSSGNVVFEKTLWLIPFLERWGIVKNKKYVYKPDYFNFSIIVKGANVTYAPKKFEAVVVQRLREPDVNDESDCNGKWKIWGRVIKGKEEAQVKDHYCSGPWDFNELGIGYTCSNMAGWEGSGGGGGETCFGDGEPCQTNEDCCQGCFCIRGTCHCPEPEASFLPGTKISLHHGTKNIEFIRTGDKVLSFDNGKIVVKKVSSVRSPIRTDHYYVLRTKNREVEVTENHEFYTPEGFRKVSEINVGDDVYVLEGNKLATEKIIFKKIIHRPVNVYDFEVEGTHTFFANGFAVHNDASVGIIKGAWDNNGKAWESSVQENTLLYFEVGDSKHVPNEPAPNKGIDGIEWKTAHSWKLETYIHPARSVGSEDFRIYPDDGARIFVYHLNLNNGEWEQVFNTSCLLSDRYAQGKSTGCVVKGFKITDTGEKSWYKFDVYLYNDPGGRTGSGEEDTNPLGIRIEDKQATDNSLFDLFSSKDKRVCISSEAPGADGAEIKTVGSVFGNQGLVEVRDLTMPSTDFELKNPKCGDDVICDLRAACGSDEYEGLETTKYGWIINHRIYPESWEKRETAVKRRGYIEANGKKIKFDPSSLKRANRRRFIPPDVKYSGGIYKCRKNWPAWEYECNAGDRYSYKRGSDEIKCCYVSEFDINPDDSITLNNYESGYEYIINFLPPKGSKLCAIAETKSGSPQEIYKAHYTNQLCDTKTGENCCYCRKGYGCKLNCLNENEEPGYSFALPFDTSGQTWEIKNIGIEILPEPAGVVDLNAEGNAKDGWKITAKISESAQNLLYRNFTIPINLYDDFGIIAPEKHGRYNLKIKVTYAGQPSYARYENLTTFYSVGCTKENESRLFYNETLYPGTKGIGACKPGKQICHDLSRYPAYVDFEWEYENTHDYPVYPTNETCNGIDDDCNGLVDDIGGFDWIINQMVSTGVFSPYKITKCGCFETQPSVETCNGIDDDCDGVIDNKKKTIFVNTCDESVINCTNQGNPYTFCKQLYNSSLCELREVEINIPKNLTINTCTEKVRKCMENEHIKRVSFFAKAMKTKYTYDECKHLYDDVSCILENVYINVLGDTCACSNGGQPSVETCNGIDDDCDGIIDDVSNPETCGCSYLTDIAEIEENKKNGDYSCNGIDDDCDGIIDEDAANCACARRPPAEVRNIKNKVREMCDGIDNDCDGLVDEDFPEIGKPCGYGLCSGGVYVCNVHGDEAVCNTTVNPDETFSGNAMKLSHEEVCDLKDNDCDYSIDEDCECTPEGAVKVCGYQSGIYYRDKQNLDNVCNEVIEKLKKLITWAEAPENVKYRRLITVENTEDVYLKNYPVMISLNTAMLKNYGRVRRDGGDIRIVPEGEETYLDWANATKFNWPKTDIWFRADIRPHELKKFYVYYGNPTATYKPKQISEILGIPYERGVFLLCHFDNSSACEGNMVPEHEKRAYFTYGKYDLGVVVNDLGVLSYPTSENFNKNRGTIEVWVKPDDFEETHYIFYSEDFYGNPQFKIYFNASGLFFDVYDRQGDMHRVNGSGLTLGRWGHIAASWDTLHGMNLYINGRLVDSKEITWNMNDIGLDVYIGCNSTGSARSPVMDELVIRSQMLSEEKIRTDMRYYEPSVLLGPEETLNQTKTTSSNIDIFRKCNEMLENVTTSGDERKATILSLCDSVRICNKTDFPINPISECTFGVQECLNGVWGSCSGVQPKTEICNQKDDDCNGVVDDILFPETCACSNGGQPSVETCNGIDDDCDGIVDNVMGGNSVESTHCGCFNQTVNITQRHAEPEEACNGIDDNCNGIIDEGLDNCACEGTVFSPYNNTWAQAISVETCNGIDDDCDGVIDNPWQKNGSQATKFKYLGASCSMVNSRCVGGVYVCSLDGKSLECNTMSDNALGGEDKRQPEVCNGIDDDCDGVIDNLWGTYSNKFCGCYNGEPKKEEICNGIDDDCDGIIDDGLSNCGCSFDTIVNATNINRMASLINTKRMSEEVCNNIDDNCDGIIDNVNKTQSCFCSGGFEGNPLNRIEFCNGIDDDCDGIIDDVSNPETCGCYQGEQPSAEVCDGVDNDCDGLVDEDWPELGSACGYGACKGGVFVCSDDKQGVVCSTGPGGPEDKSSEEICGDGIDNDCDGAIDESCECDVVGKTKECGTDVGECKKGVQTCTDDGWGPCVGSVGPQPEVCDGKDNDCDGVIDNSPYCGCYGDKNPATEICNGIDDDCDGIVDNVNGGSSVESTKCGCYGMQFGKGAKTEICNGIDDDCDGTIDNVKGGSSVAATRCACYNGGQPSVETCNGIDDDCDGIIDEDWPTLGKPCGEGICAGVYVCSEDGKTVVCNGAEPEVEICDGKDNDCDGAIDEGCFGAGVSSCENGVQDGDEEGVDCGGTCPNPCAPVKQMPISGEWIMVFIAIVVIIVILGFALMYFK
ncbi:MAG: hypothetical protein J7K72_01410 [Candidatus Aenigmarchaeota archaeon]|nr:hypothetical protein [Candidatus Aenigmarchaeota archaeon]